MAIDGHTNKIDSNQYKRKKRRKKKSNRSENVIEFVYMHGVVRGSSINDI